MATAATSSASSLASEDEKTATNMNPTSSDEAVESQSDEQPGPSSGEKVDGAKAREASSSESSEKNNTESNFECNICLDVAHDAVISMCGHLFCWPCLHQWLETRPNRQMCPVCKAAISRDKVVPLYGRGDTERKDPRDKPIPPRPRGQRTEPEANPGLGGMFSPFGGGFHGAGNGFQMSFGIGAFPFGFFATNFNLPDQARPGTAQFEEQQFLNKVFLWVALAFIFWLMIA